MKIKYFGILLSVVFLVLFPSCNKDKTPTQDRLIIAVSSDAESLNPLYSFTYFEGTVTELLYLSLVQHNWNYDHGELDTTPMLAESYTWSDDSSSIKIKLRKDVHWSDGEIVDAGDVVASFILYSHPDVQSRLYGMFKSFYLQNDLTIDKEKTFSVENPFSFTIYFKDDANPSLMDIDIPLLPEHIFSAIPFNEIAQKEKELAPITNGAYKLKTWNKNQSIILTANKNSFLHKTGGINEIVFSVVPDYNSRLTQLRNGEVHLMEDLRPDDAEKLKAAEELIVAPIEGREYDYLGWNNIDVNEYNKTGYKIPHKIFGSAPVRKALTHAINREEILNEYFNNFGQIAIGPVAPIFKDFYNSSISPYQFNPGLAKQLLKGEGWKDNDGDGILEKGKNRFSFTIYIPSGNPARDFASKVIENNLKAIGADVTIEKLEPGVFFEKMFNRELEAWIAGWSVPIPIELKVYWHSNLKENPLNIACFNNKQADELLEKITLIKDANLKNNMIKEFQSIIHNEEPVTFLYWIDNLTAHNKGIDGVSVSPLGAVHHPWNWKIKP